MVYASKIASLVVLSCFVGSATGQNDAVKEKAIAQMRRIANAMKECPEQIQYQNECALHYIGPPSNLEWDVVPSKSVRSPFQGVIEFTLPMRVQDVDPSKQSKKVRQSCQEMATLAATSPEAKALASRWREGHHRYEFDLGNDAPELVKRLWVAKDKDNNIVTSAADDDHYCWTNVAREAEKNAKAQ